MKIETTIQIVINVFLIIELVYLKNKIKGINNVNDKLIEHSIKQFEINEKITKHAENQIKINKEFIELAEHQSETNEHIINFIILQLENDPTKTK